MTAFSGVSTIIRTFYHFWEKTVLLSDTCDIIVHNNRIRNCKVKSREVIFCSIHASYVLSVSIAFVLQYPSFHSRSLRKRLRVGAVFYVVQVLPIFF